MRVPSQQFFAFNAWDLPSAKCVVDACSQQNQLAYVQTSEKVFTRLSAPEFADSLKHYAEDTGADLILALDHCTDPELVAQALDAGWTAIMFDGSGLPLAENIAVSRRASVACHECDALFEAEVGQIPRMGVNDFSETSNTPLLSDVERFLSGVPVDLLAVPVGTAHGPFGQSVPQINYGLIELLDTVTDAPLVVHGGSGLSDAELKRLLAHRNIRKINISTDLKLAYRQALLDSLSAPGVTEERFDPNAVYDRARQYITQTISEKLAILD